jgi:hypothetical protein
MSHLTTSPPRDKRPAATRSDWRGRRLRRGYVSLAAIMVIMIGILTLMLVANWTYLVLVSRHTLRLSDNLALTAVYQLLDEDVLSDSHNFPDSQVDDVLAAENEIKAPGTGFLDRNNAAAGERFRPTASQVFITPARIDDASAPVVEPTNYDETPGPGEPFNTLRVEIFRDPNGLNPVELIFRGQGAPDTAKITSASYATVDSRVVGFRPTATVSAPVVPLALNSNAWFTTRVSGMDDSQLVDGRFELDFTLLSTSGLGTANSAVLSLDDTAAFNPAVVAAQVVNGIGPGDVNGVTGMIGPLTAAAPVDFNAQQVSPAGQVGAIAAAFNAVAASNNPRRVFPIYQAGFTNPLSIVGFIGARIINADATDVGSGPRLRVRLQPDFVVHSTVETRREFPAATSVPENLYIHKIRLTR